MPTPHKLRISCDSAYNSAILMSQGTNLGCRSFLSTHFRLQARGVVNKWTRSARMPKFALIGTIEIAPGRTEEFVPLLMAHRAGCLQDEPGTLRFDVLLPREGTTKVMLYELYRDEAAFDTHWNGPSPARFREETAGMITAVSGNYARKGDPWLWLASASRHSQRSLTRSTCCVWFSHPDYL